MRCCSLLHRFYARCAASDRPKFHRLATAAETWWQQTLTFLTTGITNAAFKWYQIGHQDIARDAGGIRNRENQHLRMRAAIARRHRGHLNAA